MKRKLLTLIPAIIIAAVVALNISVCIEALKYDTFEIELDKGTGISKVSINKNDIELERYLGDNLEIIEKEIKKEDGNEEKTNVLYAKKSSKVSIMISDIDDLYIEFYGNTDKIKALYDGNIIEIKDGILYRSVVRMDVLKNSLSMNTLWFFLIALPICYIIVYYAVYFIRKLKREDVKLYEIMLFLLGMFITFLFSFYMFMYISKILVVFSITGICGFCVYYLKDEIKENIEKIYIILAIFTGLCIMFIIPPFNVPDEGAHFTKSFDYTINSDRKSGYCNLPESISNFRYKYEHSWNNYIANWDVKTYFQDFFETSDYSKINDKVVAYPNTSKLALMAYLPSTILFAGLRVIGASPFVLFFSGRFLNLFIMIVLCYYAIRNLPRFKKIFFVVCLMPMVLQQGMGLNQDWLTNTIGISCLAYIIKMKYAYDKITWKNIAILSAMAFVLAYCKFGYFVILLFAALIPNEKFQNKKIAIVFKVLIVLIPFILGYIQNMNTIAIGNDEDANFNTFSSALSNPIQFIKVYLNTLYTRGVLDFYNGLFDGFCVSTKWLESLPQFIISAIYLILILSAGNEDKKLSLFDRISIFIIGAANIGIIYSSLYFTWTHEGASTVEGLQPRYFVLPVLMMYMALSNNNIKIDFKNRGLVYAVGVTTVHFIVLLSLAVALY